MKPLDKYYVKFNKWTGKIYQVSSSSISETDPNCIYIDLNTKIIQDIFADKRSLESSYISYIQDEDKYTTYTKTGVIYLFPPEKFFTEVKTKKMDAPDINLTLYTNNKLLDIEVTLNGVKTWYNHRQGKDFLFAFNPEFIFQILNKQNKIIKTITLKSHVFLENFKTTVDLSDIDNLQNVKIKTMRLLKNYFLKIKKYKYFKEDEVNSKNNFSKVDLEKKIEIYDLMIFRTNVENTILVKNNIDKIYKELSFYVTGKEPNELYDIVTIPVKELWDKKTILIKLKYGLENKILWKSNSKITVLFNNKKVIEI